MKRVSFFFIVAAILAYSGDGLSHDKSFKHTPPLKNVKPKFFIQQLSSSNEYQPLLEGLQNSVGLEAGRVTKLKGKKGEKHNTKIYEEILIALEGKGYIKIEGEKHELNKGDIVYIPPQTEHQVGNDKSKKFEYIYVAAPTLGVFH